MRFRERLQRFMYGRYGMDAYGKFLSWTSMILLILSMFIRLKWNILYYVALALLVYCYFRVFSRNVQKRYQENCTYYRYTNKIREFFNRQKSYAQQSKTHRIFKCPSCGQKIRVPKGKGRIAIRCRTCGTEFIKKT
ncbi:MAG: hypothetical protein E7260_09285 [Lachnospiraceae bacterium]|nr:hypothetical protein [Lachnospiraceae bacterium]